jgi:hypothetical protein
MVGDDEGYNGSGYGTVVFHLFSLLQKKTKPHASFTLNIYPEPLGDLHLTIRHLVTDTDA